LDILDDESSLGNTTRRVTRIATLDGGAALNDFGHSYADRTVTLRWEPTSPQQLQNLERMVRLYSKLLLAKDDGLFLVAPRALITENQIYELELLMLEKLS
jgi:hypothetical protein